MFPSNFPFPALFVLTLGKVSEKVAVDMGERSQSSDQDGIPEEVFELYLALS